VKPDADPVGPAHGATVEDARPGARELGALRALLWALVAVMTVAWLFLGGGLDAIRGTIWPAPPTTAPEVGRPAPALALPLAGGGEVDLAQHRGQVVLVNFWATWCEPCREEMPSMEALRASMQGRPLVVLAVNVGESARVARGFGDKVSLRFPLLLDRDTKTTKAWGARVLPASFVVGPDGRIRYSCLGAIDWAAAPVKSAIERLMP
jgi:cytochrome c biogenesis protein CcmG, thiol:disulfide interchange protein DsbE